MFVPVAWCLMVDAAVCALCLDKNRRQGTWSKSLHVWLGNLCQDYFMASIRLNSPRSKRQLIGPVFF